MQKIYVYRLIKPKGILPEDVAKLIKQYGWKIKDFYLEHVQSLRIESETPMPDKLKKELNKLCNVEYVQ